MVVEQAEWLGVFMSDMYKSLPRDVPSSAAFKSSCLQNAQAPRYINTRPKPSGYHDGAAFSELRFLECDLTPLNLAHLLTQAPVLFMSEDRLRPAFIRLFALLDRRDCTGVNPSLLS